MLRLLLFRVGFDTSENKDVAWSKFLAWIRQALLIEPDQRKSPRPQDVDEPANHKYEEVIGLARHHPKRELAQNKFKRQGRAFREPRREVVNQTLGVVPAGLVQSHSVYMDHERHCGSKVTNLVDRMILEIIKLHKLPPKAATYASVWQHRLLEAT